MAFLTEPLIPVGEYEARKSKRGLCEVFQAQHEVDIVFTSMGDCHTHDELIQMLDLTSTEVTERELAGSVQYRLYTERGKYVEGPKEMRVATLFELDDLVQMASPDSGKSVVLIARPCTSHRCNARKTEALKPLLTVPSLRVFSHLILDTETAVELLAWKESLAGNGAPSTDQIQAPSEQNT